MSDFRHHFAAGAAWMAGAALLSLPAGFLWGAGKALSDLWAAGWGR